MDQLHEIVEKLTREAGGVSTRLMGLPVEGPARLALEAGVPISGEQEGMLVLRASKGLGDLLASWAGEGAGEEAFLPFCSLVCDHLLSSLWKPGMAVFHEGEARPLGTVDWPAGEPDSACAILIQNEPLEVRLWLKR